MTPDMSRPKRTLTRFCRHVPYMALLTLALMATMLYVCSYYDADLYIWLSDMRPAGRTSCQRLEVPLDILDRNMSIGVVVVYNIDGGAWNSKLMTKVLQNKQAYCNRHGYTLINGNELVDKGRPVAWSKLLVIEKHMEMNQFDYLFYIDMDAIIMNQEFNLQRLIAAAPEADIIMSADWNGLNTGVWLARNSKWTLWFLKTAWDQSHLLSKKSKTGISHPFEYEQRAFHHLTHSEVWEKRKLPKYEGDIADIRSHFHVLPQCSMNSYSMHPLDYRGKRTETQYIPGDFIVHFAGKKGTLKSELMDHYLDLSFNSNHHH